MSVIFVDTETTGLDPERHEVWEIALIEQDGTEHVWRLKPRGLPDPGALRVNRMYERIAAWRASDLSRVRDFWDSDADPVAWQIARLTSNQQLVGIVPDFDARFLEKFLNRQGYGAPWHYQTIDVEVMAAGLLRLPPPWDTADIIAELGLPPTPEEEKHTALGDALTAYAMWAAIYGSA